MSGTLRFIRRSAPWIVIVVVAVLAILGILTRTAWAPDPLWTATVKPSADTRLVISDPGVLNLLADEVTIEATVVPGEDLAPEPEDPEDPDDPDAEPGDEETPADDEDGAVEEDADAAEAEAEEPGVVISIAREVDAQGWIGEAAALQLTGLQTESTLRTSAIEGELEAAADPDSDLWWHTAEGTDEAQLVWKKEPGRWSVVIASSPDTKISQVSFTWPQSTATPAAMPLILVGAFLILAGAALLLFPQLLDKGARNNLLESLREKSAGKGPKSGPAGTETDAADTAATVADAAQADAAEADGVDNDAVETDAAKPDVTAPVVKPQAEAAAETEDVPVAAPAVSAPEQEEAARFTPGTMTRRQIRELERARQEAARRKAEGSRPHPQPAAVEPEPEAAADDVTDAPQTDGNDETAAEADASRIRRSDHWRKTWGVDTENQPDARTTSWLPESVTDEEENRDA